MVDWALIRRLAAGRYDAPPEWPQNVRPVSLEGITLLGIDPKTNDLYWDGQKLVTEKRWGTTERRIAVGGLILAGLGVAATIVQAWFAAFPPA